jgi:predicted HNH restriction endonuclease
MSPKEAAGDRQRWEQETAFPIIADAIRRLYRPDVDNFVSKREIVPMLLRDPHSRTLIEAAYKQTGREWPIEQYTGNMVQWFSQRWTVGHPKWLSLFNEFERNDEKIDGCWAYKPLARSAVNVFPDELEDEVTETLPEGAAIKRLVNAYERNPLARQKCIEKYGSKCCVCGFSFGASYGQAVDGFIHVHHLRQLSKVGKNYKVDPVADLRPVCPNCHAVIHHRDPAYSIDEVQSFLRSQGESRREPASK